MPQSLSDIINLIASVISIIGGMISIGGVIYKWSVKPGSAPAKKPSERTTSTWPPASAPAPSRQPSGGPARQPSGGPARQPAAHQTTQRAGRGVSHPAILSFSALGMLAVITYSIELIVNYAQSGGVSTGIAASSPLLGVNAVLIALNLICVVVVTVGMAVTAYRAQRRGWLAAGVIALVVSLCTIGIFSAVALVPGVFYGLSGPREQDAWRS